MLELQSGEVGVEFCWRFTCRNCTRESRWREYPQAARAAQIHAEAGIHAAQLEAVFAEAPTPEGYRRRAWRGRPGPPRRL